MAVYIKTNNPQELYERFKNKLSEIIAPVWKVDKDGDLEFIPDGTNNAAWLRVHFLPKNLAFGIIGAKEKTMTKNRYSLYHTEIAKFMLNHFDDEIISIRITPQKVENIDYYK